MHAERLTAQLLSGPKPNNAEAAVERLLAVQAQDARGFRLAVRPRTKETSAADLDAALTDRRSLVVSWLNRGTLHLVSAADYWWLHPLTTPQLATGNATRLKQEGVSPEQADRGVAVINHEVAVHGPRTRHQLRDALEAAGVPTAGQALVHVIFAASIRGDLIRGPVRGNEQCFVSAAAWLGGSPGPLDPDEALGRLALRYLTGHGPASDRDLAKWAGIALGAARRGLSACGTDIVERGEGRFDLRDRPSAAPVPGPLLLGPFDPLLCGWVSRDDVVGEHRGLVTNNGLFRAFALVNGRAVATWGLDAGRVTVRLLEPVTAADRQALEREAVDVLRYLGLRAGDVALVET
jgi:hypothetical protein